MSATKALRARAPRRACDVAVVLDGAASSEQAAPGAPATGTGAGAAPPAGWADGVRVPEIADLAALPPGRLATARRQLAHVTDRAGAFIDANRRSHAALDALLAAVYRYVCRHRATPALLAALAASSGLRLTAATRRCPFFLLLRIVAKDVDRRDASTYATALRYLAARGVAPNRAAEAIRAFGGVVACAALERRRKRAAQTREAASANDAPALHDRGTAGPGPTMSAAAAEPRLFLVLCERLPDGRSVVKGRIEDPAAVAQVTRCVLPRPAVLGPDGRPLSRGPGVPMEAPETPVPASAADKREAKERAAGRPGRRRAQARRPGRPEGGTEADGAPTPTAKRPSHETHQAERQERDWSPRRRRGPGGRMRRDRRPGAGPAPHQQR